MKKINNFFRGITILCFLISMSSYGQNSTCATAAPLTIGGTACSGTSGGPNSGDPTGFDGTDNNVCSSSYSGGDDYIFEYTATTADALQLDLNATNTWTGLLVTAGCPTTGTCFASATSSSSNESLVTPPMTIGTTYYIQISTYPTPNSPGQFCLDANLTAPPEPIANETCATAQPIACGETISATTDGTTGSNTETGGCNQSNYGVWYTFTGDGNAYTYDLVAENISLDLEMSISSGSCGSLTNIACRDAAGSGDETYSLDSVDGTQYYIYISYYSTFGTTTGDFTLTATCVAGPTCTDGIQNGDEEDIDCGGTACAPCPPSYCDPDPSSIDSTGLTSVTVEGTVFPSLAATGYEDFTALPSVNLSQVLTSTVVIDYSHSYDYYTRIWIDFNDDFVFDESEVVFEVPNSTDDPVNAEFIIPVDPATVGNHRMRIGGHDYAYPDPCWTGSYAAFMDVTVKIQGPPACGPADIANTEVSANCTSGSEGFTVNVDVAFANWGNTIIDSNGGEWPIAPFAPGNYPIGPFDDGDSVELTMQHLDGPTSLCNFSIGTFTNTCPPEYDLCPGATLVTVGVEECGPDVTGTNADTTDSGVTQASCATATYSGGDIWYTFVMPASQTTLIYNRSASDFSTTQAELYSGACGALIEEDCTTSTSDSFEGLTAGATYYLRIYDWGNNDIGDVTFCLGTPPPPPANDLCADALPLACGDALEGFNAAATDVGEGPTCGTSPGDSGVWYAFEGNETEVTITTCNAATDFDTKINVYTGECGALVCETGDDDATCTHSNLHSEATFIARTGVTYYVYVSGFGSASGNFVLSAECGPTPYVLISTEQDMSLRDNINVISGGVGVMTDGQQLKVDQDSHILAFGEASQIAISNGSTVATEILAPAAPVLLAFENNAYSSGSSPSVTVNNGETTHLLESVYKHVVVEEGGTAIFIQPNVYIDELKMRKGATLEFIGCTNVMINRNFQVAEGGTINADQNTVTFFVDNMISIEKGSDVNAHMYASNNFSADGGGINGEITTLEGVFVGEKVDLKKNVKVAAHIYDVSCAVEPPRGVPLAGEFCFFPVEIACNETVTGDTSLFDVEDVDFCGTSLSSASGVWHVLTGTGDVITATADTFGSSFDTKIGVFTGSCGDLVCLGGDDDASDPFSLQSEFEFNTVAGESYYIYVTGFSSNAGAYTLNVTCDLPPEPCDSSDENVTISINYDNFPTETAWTITDENNNVVASGSGSSGDTTFIQTVALCSSGCYDFEITDSFGDGICCTYGSGSYSVTDGFGNIVASGGDFGSSETTNFCLSGGARMASPDAITTDDEIKLDWDLYPNPTKSNQVTLGLQDYMGQDVTFEVLDYTGKVLVQESFSNLRNAKQTVSLNNIINGVYVVRLTTRNGVSTKQLIVSY